MFLSIKKLSKKILISLTLLSILLAMFLVVSTKPVSATLSPLSDTQCWTQSMCASRTNNCSYCFKEDEGPCSAPFGRCYHPHEPIDLQIELGSTGSVTDVAEYIALAYRYILGIGGILAVIVVIAGGFIYITAGGNTSKFDQAKQYIGGAVVGTILLFGSYLILDTLNPDLVKLRMPKIHMVRPANLPATFCAEIDWGEGNENPTFYRADDAEEGRSPTYPRRLKDYAEATSSGGRSYAPDRLTCNWAFYSPTVGGQVPCYGNGGCASDEEGNPSVCARDPSREGDWFVCRQGYISGDIEYGEYDLYGEGNQLQVIYMRIRALCNDNTREFLGSMMNTDQDAMPAYVLTFSTMASLIRDGEDYEQHLRENTCSGHGGLKGIFLGMRLEENDILLDDGAWDRGSEDGYYTFWFGKNACTNTSGNRYSITFREYGGIRTQWQDVPTEELWSFDEIFSEPRVRCNLRLEDRPNSFPVRE